MKIVTNPGSNLPRKAVEHYGIVLTPQQIVVDGVSHDTRDGVAISTVDSWIKSAREYPHVVGTTALEFTQIFSQLAKEEREILPIMTSRKVIQSHAAALAAAHAVLERPAFSNVAISVVDSTFTDIATGLLCLAAGEAAKAKIPLRTTVATLEKLAARGRLTLAISTLDNLVKGGRAGFLRAFIANFFDMKPIIGMIDGELKTIGKASGKSDLTAAIADDLKLIGEKRRVWVGVAHGNSPTEAARLLEMLRAQFDVAFAIVMPLTPSIYLHGGRGSLFGTVMPIDDLPWTPTTPPSSILV